MNSPMDNFNYGLTIFPGFDRGSYVAVYWEVRKLLDFIKDILICVWRWTKVLWVWNDMRVSN